MAKKLLVILRGAFQSLTVHKLRSALTMLGVVIGVGAVIALVAVGRGTQAQVMSQLQSLGSNILIVSPQIRFGFSRTGLQQSVRRFTNAEVDAIKALATSVRLVAPEYSTSVTVSHLGKTASITVRGVTPEYAEVRNWSVANGRFITAEDNTNMSAVVVLGQTAVEELFGSTLVNPIGDTVRINRQNYTVVGVLKAKGGNNDNVIFMPLRTAQVKLGGAGNKEITSISLQVRSDKEMDFAQAQVRAILRTLHGLSATANDDFMIQNQADLLNTVESTTGAFTTLLGSIAAISLLVGGIGIMNIMLVSVTERTREIGLRKAVGAKRSDILLQFLVEAVVLSGIGGIIGVIAGAGAAQIITPLFGTRQALVTVDSVVLALVVSLAVGIFFGLYPANRAARLNPIDALRYE
jgi:putative ABC transport system permease protein